MGMSGMRGCAGDHFELEMRSSDGRIWNCMSADLESELEGMQVLHFCRGIFWLIAHNSQVRQRDCDEQES